MARNSCKKMTRSLIMVPLECGLCCADDGSPHLHVFLGSGTCGSCTVVACE